MYVDHEAIAQALHDAAPYIREWLATNRDQLYSLTQIESALHCWAERSLAALIEECVFHCVEGSTPHAVGRHDFELGLARAYVSSQK